MTDSTPSEDRTVAELIASGEGLACYRDRDPDEFDSWDDEIHAPDPAGPEWGA